MFLDRCKPKFIETFIWLWMLVPVEYVCILIRIIAYKCKHGLHLLPEPGAEIFENILFWQGYLLLGLLNSTIVLFMILAIGSTIRLVTQTNQIFLMSKI